MVEGARLEFVWGLTAPVGSNPTLSASPRKTAVLRNRRVAKQLCFATPPLNVLGSL